MKLSEVKSIMNQDVSFEIEEIHPNLIQVRFKTVQDLTSTFLRFGEHYESPKFRNKVFSLEEYYDWYVKETDGFEYLTYWFGYNIPSRIFKPFLNGEFKNLTKRETQLLEAIKDRKDKFYIIGTYNEKNKKENKTHTKHEIAHALFYLNPKYRKSVLKELETIDLAPINQDLKERGYHRAVYKDEAQAYIVSDYSYLTDFYKGRKDLYLNLNKLFKQALKELK